MSDTSASAVECLDVVVRIVETKIKAPCDADMGGLDIAGVLPLLKTLFDSRFLKGHQVDGVVHILSRYNLGFGSILGDEMGLGKTRQAVVAMAMLRRLGVMGPMIVAAPVALLAAWQNEFADYVAFIGCSGRPEFPPPVVYSGSFKDDKLRRDDLGAHVTKAHRSRAPILEDLMRDCREGRWAVLLTTHGMMTQPQDFEAIRRLPGLLDPPTRWGLVVVDEAHRAKNHRAYFNRRLMRLDPEAFLLVTGTFVHNDLHKELMALIRLMLPPCLQCYDIVSHVDAITEDELWDPKTGRPHAAVELIARMLRTFLIRRVFGMPEVDTALKLRRRFTIRVPMTPLQQRVYELLQARRRAAKGGGAKPAAPGEPGVQEEEAGREKKKKEKEAMYHDMLTCDVHPFMLRQFFNKDKLPDPTAVPPGSADELEELVFGASHKMRALFELIEALKAAGHRTLVFSNRMASLAMIALLLRRRAISFDVITGSTKTSSRPAHMAEFQERVNAPWVMLLSTTAMGQGVTLTRADTVIFYDHHHNPQNDKQAEARAYRIGQDSPVAVFHLVTQASAEQKSIEGRIAAKRRIQDWFEYDVPMRRQPARDRITVPEVGWAEAKASALNRTGWSDATPEHVCCDYEPPDRAPRKEVEAFKGLCRNDRARDRLLKIQSAEPAKINKKKRVRDGDVDPEPASMARRSASASVGGPR